MARASKPGIASKSTGDDFTAAECNAIDTAIDAVIDDYVSQTDTTEQNLASNLNIGAKLLKTTNLALKEESASVFSLRDAGDTIYKGVLGNLLQASDRVYTDQIDEFTGSAGITFSHDHHLGVTAASRTISAETLGVGATTFAVTGEAKVMTGDGGGNTIATITGGRTGQILYLIFTDANITITDTDAHTANTVDLSAAFVSADDTTLTLIFDGTSWYELSRSVN